MLYSLIRVLRFVLISLAVSLGGAASAMASDNDTVANSNYEQLRMLDRQIERVDEDMPSLGLPITMTAVGFGVGALGIAGYASTCSLGCSGGLLAAAIGGMALGVGGAIFTTVRVIKRRPYKLKLEKLEEQRDALELRLDAAPLGGMASLRYVF